MPERSLGSGTQIASTSRGPIEYKLVGTGTPVLILHGSPGGIDQAAIMARFLPAEQIQAVLVSRPGYLGTALGERQSLDAQAELMIALLDQLGIERIGLLAWSGGGPTAYRMAVRYADRIRAVVAIAAVSKAFEQPKADLSTRLMFGTRAGEWLLRVLAAHQPKQIVTGTLQSEGSLTKEQRAQRVDEVMADDTKRQFLLDLSATVAQNGDRKAGWDNDLEVFAAIDNLELESITAPCLIVQGSADSDVTPDYSTEAARRIPNAELALLELGTHMAFYTHPDATAIQARAIEFLLR